MWKNISINKNQIKVETERAYLINCPHNSKYNGFSFWHPAKLVREGKHTEALSIGYNETFTFKLIKYGKGKYNSRDIIEEKEITVEEFENMFNLTDENILKPKIKNEFETHKPDDKNSVENNLLEELKDE